MDIRQRNGVLLNMAAAAAFAFLPTITKAIYDVSALRPTDIALWRFAFAVPLLWLMAWVQRRGRPASDESKPVPLRRLILPGILYTSNTLLAFAGLQSGISVSLFILLFYTYPAMVALLDLVMGKPLSMYGWLALLLTLIGVVLTVPDLSSLTADSWMGIMFALLNALSVAVYFLVTAWAYRGSTDTTRNTAGTLTVTLLLLLCVVPFNGLELPPSLPALLLLLTLAFVCSAISIVALNAGIQRIGAAQSAIVSSIEPVVAMVLALVLLGEPVLPLQWVGAVFIITAVVLLQVRPAPQPIPAGT